MNYNTIKIRYVPVQCDVWTEVMVKDHFANVSAHEFEEDEEADAFVRNLPGDYFVYDFRKNHDVAEGYYVRALRH